MIKHLQIPAILPDTTSDGLHLAAGDPAHQYQLTFQSPNPVFLSLWPLHKAQALLPGPTPTQAGRSAVAMVTSKPTLQYPGCIHAKKLHLTPMAGQREGAGVGSRGRYVSRAQQNLRAFFPSQKEAVGYLRSSGKQAYPAGPALSPASCSIQCSSPPPFPETVSREGTRAPAQKPPARLGHGPLPSQLSHQKMGAVLGLLLLRLGQP